jgi:F-type H+-transporting ATPase subunit b
MEINATLLGQIITFLGLLFLLNRYLYEPLNGLLEERRSKINQGLEDAEKGEIFLREAETKKEEVIEAGKEEAKSIIEKAHKRATLLEEEAVSRGKERESQLIEAAEEELINEKQKAKHELTKDVGDLIILAASKLVDTELDAKKHKKLIDNFIAEFQ